MLALRTGRRPSVYWGYSQCVYMRAFFRHAKDIALRKSAIHIGPSSPGARNPARGRTPAMGGERQRQKRKEEKKALMVSGTFISRIITPKMWGIGDMVQVVTYIDQSSSQMFHSNAKKAYLFDLTSSDGENMGRREAYFFPLTLVAWRKHQPV